jgi:aldose 1-epimerase
MTIHTLAAGPYLVRISPQGGVIVDGTYAGVPIFRPYVGKGPIDPLKCGSFPLVPFGNRVEENRFSHAGREYSLAPNTDWDRHYLHGDGWLRLWTLTDLDDRSARMNLDVASDVYTYRAEQRFDLSEHGLDLGLSVTNTGPLPMPFGIGHHPFFPLTPQTRLTAPATGYWSEKHDYLPDRLGAVPPDLDYSAPAPIPGRWVNNGFEGWTGQARIDWPERGIALEVSTPGCARYFLFRSDTSFDAGFRGDFFCFEPMSHSANGQNLAESGLVVLQPSERLEIQVRLEAVTI